MFMRRRPWQLASVVGVRLDWRSRLRSGRTNLLVDEHSNNEDGDKEDNDEDDNDTGFALGPVVALGELVDGVLCASSEGHGDGGHCVGVGFAGAMLDTVSDEASQKLSKSQAQNVRQC